MRGRRHALEVEFGHLPDRLEDRAQLPAEPLDLLVRQRQPRELRDVQHLVLSMISMRRILPKRRAPFRGPWQQVPKGSSRAERRSPPAGPSGPARPRTRPSDPRSASCTRRLDRAEVDEHVLALTPLDESVALLVREPLHGALCQNILLLYYKTTTARAPSRRPRVSGPNVSVRLPGTQAAARDISQP